MRAAQRNSLHELEGMALHALFGVSVEAGREQEAGELARVAYNAYGAHSRHVPRLAQDVAYWWITQGYFSRAVPVLRSLLPHLPQPADRLMVFGNIARAAGGLGDRETFREAWVECFDLLHNAAVDERAAQGLLDLAYGAASLGLWDKAEMAAREALEIGSRRQEAKIRLTAESVIESVRHHRGLETRRRAAEADEKAAADASLAEEFVRSLQTANA
jgi:hypothetical protein